jgi:autophagy-related protein 18
MAYPQPSRQPAQAFNQPAHAPPTANYLPPSTGEVLVFDANKMESVNVIEAHQTTLGCLSISSSGALLATASEKGTIIRVFSVPGGEKLFHFRRGSLPAQIYCMSFNATSSLLSVSSATETIHIFRLVPQQSPFKSQESPPTTPSSAAKALEISSRPRGESFGSYRERSNSPSSEDPGTPTDISPIQRKHSSQTLASMIRRTSQTVGLSLAARVGGYLPSSVTEMWEPARDFAWVKVPRLKSLAGTIVNPVKSVVAMSAGHPQLLVVTSDGQFLAFHVDLENGGEGILEKEYSYVSCYSCPNGQLY